MAKYSKQQIQLTRLMDKMMRDKRLHNAKLPIALKMLFLSKSTGKCTAGHTALANMLDLSPRYVSTVKADLVTYRYFKKARSGNGRGKTDWYEPIYETIDASNANDDAELYKRSGIIDNDTGEEVPEPKSYDWNEALFGKEEE